MEEEKPSRNTQIKIQRNLFPTIDRWRTGAGDAAARVRVALGVPGLSGGARANSRRAAGAQDCVAGVRGTRLDHARGPGSRRRHGLGGPEETGRPLGPRRLGRLPIHAELEAVVARRRRHCSLFRGGARSRTLSPRGEETGRRWRPTWAWWCGRWDCASADSRRKRRRTARRTSEGPPSLFFCFFADETTSAGVAGNPPRAHTCAQAAGAAVLAGEPVGEEHRRESGHDDAQARSQRRRPTTRLMNSRGFSTLNFDTSVVFDSSRVSNETRSVARFRSLSR